MTNEYLVSCASVKGKGPHSVRVGEGFPAGGMGKVRLER